MVYLTEDDWKKYFLPRLFEDNESYINELKFIKNIYSIMTFMNSKLKVSNQRILSTSMVYFHKYYIKKLKNIIIHLSLIDKLIICGSCIFIATKTTNNLISSSLIINIIKDIVVNKLSNLNLDNESIKNMIFEKEFDILNSLEFCANVDLPYKFVLRLKNYFEKNTNISSEILIKSCCQYINDSFFFPVSLYYTPNTISISCINIMKEKFNLDDINLNDIISLSEYKIDSNELNECYLILEKLFDKLY